LIRRPRYRQASGNNVKVSLIKVTKRKVSFSRVTVRKANLSKGTMR
jgi:hypothetical protein